VKQSKPQSTSRHDSHTKRRAFSLITLLFPFLLLTALEFTLRISNYGADVSLFTTEVLNGKTYNVMNPAVKARYFSRVDFSPNTSPDYFQIPKPDSTFRIFCLGGSTTAGFPYSFVGSFSTFLRDRLKTMFPDKRIEVVNLGVTATNSYTVLDVAKELVDYQPDLFLVYDGHNEFYGALGIASHESFVGSRWFTQLYLKLVHFRSFQLFRNLFSHVMSLSGNNSAEQQTGTMMERLARGQYIPYGSEKYRQCLENYKANVEELADLCKNNNISLFLGAQVSNLRDRAPFVSVDAETKSPAEVDILLTTGKNSLEDNLYPNAFVSFQKALSIDSTRADAQYCMARTLDSLGRKQEALAHYIKARDYDMLRFRMSSDFNNVLRRMDDDKLITFVDIERKFKANSPDSLIGNTLILEHLHPNARGYFLMAKEYVWMMHWRKLIVHTDDEWNRRDNLDDEKLWNERPITELDERCAQRRTELLKAGWPFRNESVPVPDVDRKDTIGVIAEQVVRGFISWEEGHVAVADHYARRGDFAKLEREYKTLINQIPLNISAYLLLAQVYLQQNKNLEAATILVRSLEVEKTVFAYRTLGRLALDAPVAIGFFENAFLLSTSQRDKTETGYLLAEAYLRGNDRLKAVTQLQNVLTIDPQFAPAMQLLARINPATR